jgi:hypothetical protein
MAKINGVELKGIKPTLGREGKGFFGNVYIDGKRAGHAADYGDGGCLSIHIDPVFRAVFAQRWEAYAKVQNHASSYNDEDFINELFDLGEVEKQFKKETKKYSQPIVIVDIKKTTSIIPDVFYENVVGMCTFDANTTEERIQEQLKKQNIDYDRLIVYRKLVDFVIDTVTA